MPLKSVERSHACRKAIYRKGNIELLSPLSAADDTELLIMVLDREGSTETPTEPEALAE